MIDKKKVIQEYKQTVQEKGVWVVVNKHSGRVYLGSAMNLPGAFNRTRFSLEQGSHLNKQLQKDWQELGPDAFSFEVLEKLKPQDDPAYDYSEDLKILEMIWIEKYRPFEEKCYNEHERIRNA